MNAKTKKAAQRVVALLLVFIMTSSAMSMNVQAHSGMEVNAESSYEMVYEPWGEGIPPDVQNDVAIANLEVRLAYLHARRDTLLLEIENMDAAIAAYDAAIEEINSQIAAL